MFAIALLLCLFGCNRPASPPSHLTVALPSWYAPDRVPAVGAALAELGDAVEVKVLFGKREALQQKILLGAQRGDFADVALVRNEWLGPLVRSGGILPLPEKTAAAAREQALPALLPAITHEGRIYALPFDADAIVVWYRQDLARQAGLEPTLDWTIDEFLALAKALSKDKPMVAFAGQRYANAALTFLPWHFSFGGTVTQQKRLALSPAAATRALAFLASLPKKNLAPRGAGGMAQNEVFSGLAGGVYGLTVGGSWSRGMIEKQSRLADRISCLPFPGNGEHPGGTVVGGWSLVLLAGGDPQSKELLELFFNPKIQRDKLTQGGLLPARRDLLDDPWFADHRDGPTLRRSLERGRALPLHTGVDDFLNRVATAQTEVLLGRKTPSEAAAALAP